MDVAMAARLRHVDKQQILYILTIIIYSDSL